MAYHYYDNSGRKIGTVKSDQEEARDTALGIVAVVVIGIVSLIAKYWYIVLGLLVVGLVVWLCIRASKSTSRSNSEPIGQLCMEKIDILAKETREYTNHIDSIVYGSGDTTLRESLVPKVGNISVSGYDFAPSYIEDVRTKQQYKMISCSVGNDYMPIGVPYKFTTTYPPLPDKVDVVNIYRNGKMVVKNLYLKR